MSALFFFPDNTVLVNFGHINRVPLLGQLTPNLAWCEVISQECAESARQPGLASLHYAGQVFGPPWKPTDAERELTFELRTAMMEPGDGPTKHLGEAETIAIITTRQTHAIFITDDGGARRSAEAEGIKVITTWDLLRAAHRRGHLTVQDAYADAQTLDSLGRGWPPCGRSLVAFAAWIR